MISPEGATSLLPRPRSVSAGANLEFAAVLAVLLVTDGSRTISWR